MLKAPQRKGVLEAKGFCDGILPAIAEARAAGASSLRDIAAALNAREIETPRGGQWSAVQVQRVWARAA